jgi:hypothetical protein
MSTGNYVSKYTYDALAHVLIINYLLYNYLDNYALILFKRLILTRTQKLFMQYLK